MPSDRDLFDNAPIGMLLMQVDGTMVDLNAEAARMIGWPAAEIRGRHVSELIDPADLVANPIRYSIPAKATTVDFVRRLLRRDGTTFPAEIRSSLLSDGTLCSFVRDVSERSEAQESLRLSELRFRLVFDHSVDAIGVSLAGTHVFVNPAYLRLFGYDGSEELVGRPILDLVAPSSRAEVLDRVARRSRGEEIPASYTTRGLRRDGTEFDMEVHGTGYEFGGKIHTLVILRDVTESRRAEEALRVSEERYRRALELLPVGVFQHEDGRMVWANEAALRMTGATSLEQLVGQPVLRFVHPDHRPAVIERVRRMLTGETVELRAETFLRFDGSVVDVEVVAAPVDPANPRRVLVVAVDVTERRKHELALAESEALFRRILADSPISMAIVRMDGTIEYINRRAIETFGYLPQDIPDMDHWWRLAYPDEAYRTETIAIWMGLVGRAIATGGEIERREYLVNCKDRTVKSMVIFGVPIGDRVFVMFEDVTERRLAEEALIESRKELSTWHDLVTHDLANFSMTLLGLVERLLDDEVEPPTPHRRELLQRVYRQGFEMQRLAENAKLLARLRAGAMAGPVADADVAAIVAEAVESVRAVHFDRVVDIVVDCPPGLRVRGVPFLVNIFLNLVDNALRYGGKSTERRVEVRARRSESDPARIEVGVRGGLPPPEALLPTLFDRYVKGPHSSGTGLGLATVRELVVHAGGNVMARSVGDGEHPVFEVLLDLPAA